MKLKIVVIFIWKIPINVKHKNFKLNMIGRIGSIGYLASRREKKSN